MVTRRPPPLTDEERLAARKARHKRWIAILSESDWDRIRALARQVTANYVPARLDDLDASGIAVGVGWPHTGTSGSASGRSRPRSAMSWCWCGRKASAGP